MRYKTFGELRVGEEVYLISEGNVEIVSVQSAQIDGKRIFVRMGDAEYSLPLDASSIYDIMMGDIYCDINEAMRKLQDVCENAWYDFRCASSSLDYLRERKKESMS